MNDIDNVISVMASQNDFQLEPIEQVINFDQGYKKFALQTNKKTDEYGVTASTGINC